MNKVLLIGYICGENSYKVLNTKKGDIEVLDFCIAVKSKFSEESDFINLRAWSATAKYANQYIPKGTLVSVEGSLRFDKYETKEGQKRIKTYVNVETINVLKKKENASQVQQQNDGVYNEHESYNSYSVNMPYNEELGF